MIVCSCNVLNEAEVRRSIANAPLAPKDALEVYGLLGCAPKCGQCCPTIERILRELKEQDKRRDSAAGASRLVRQQLQPEEQAA